jgi:hypothetical protein
MAVDGDPVLVKPMGKYVGKVFLVAVGDITYLVRVMQYGERGGAKYCKVTCVRVEQEGVGRGRCRFYRFFSGSELLKGDFLVDGTIGTQRAGNFTGVSLIISAHSFREMVVQKKPVGLGGSSKMQKNQVILTSRRSRSLIF